MAKPALIPTDPAPQSERPRLTVALGKQTRGKAQPDDALVLTPTGFKEIGKLSVGDLVTCPDGKVASIDGVFPQGEKEIFQIEFHDGRKVECCDEHLWKVWVPLVQFETGKTHATRKAVASGKWDVVSTSWLKETLAAWGKTTWGQERLKLFSIPLVSPLAIEMPSENLPIPPYTLGALLGDGSISQQNIHFTTADQEILSYVSSDLPGYELVQLNSYDYRLKIEKNSRPSMRQAAVDAINATIDADSSYKVILRSDPKAGESRRAIKVIGNGVAQISCNGERKTISEWAKALGITSNLLQSRLAQMTTRQALGFDPRPPMNVDARTSPIKMHLDRMGLSGVKSSGKFIPDIYKRGSVSQRLALMRGLMDTDGSAAGTSAEFTSASERLARDVQELAWSLGAVARVSLPRQTYYTYKGERKLGAPSWRVRIVHPKISDFFSLTRKITACSDRNYEVRLRIKSIESIGRKKARCISVDHPDHLYVTNNYIVTHNTLLIRWLIERYSQSGTRPMRLFDADPHNPTLARHFSDVKSPESSSLEDRRVWLEQQIREQRDGAAKGEPWDAVIDWGGGDLLLARLAHEVKFTETLERAGIDLMTFYLLGPNLSDLEYFQTLDDAGFAPKKLGLVFNVGLVTAGRRADVAFDQILNAPLIARLVTRGAVPFFMPALTSDCMAKFEATGARTFREGVELMDVMWDQPRFVDWLSGEMERSMAKPLAELGWMM